MKRTIAILGACAALTLVGGRVQAHDASSSAGTYGSDSSANVSPSPMPSNDRTTTDRSAIGAAVRNGDEINDDASASPRTSDDLDNDARGGVLANDRNDRMPNTIDRNDNQATDLGRDAAGPRSMHGRDNGLEPGSR